MIWNRFDWGRLFPRAGVLIIEPLHKGLQRQNRLDAQPCRAHKSGERGRFGYEALRRRGGGLFHMGGGRAGVGDSNGQITGNNGRCHAQAEHSPIPKALIDDNGGDTLHCEHIHETVEQDGVGRGVKSCFEKVGQRGRDQEGGRNVEVGDDDHEASVVCILRVGGALKGIGDGLCDPARSQIVDGGHGNKKHIGRGGRRAESDGVANGARGCQDKNAIQFIIAYQADNGVAHAEGRKISEEGGDAQRDEKQAQTQSPQSIRRKHGIQEETGKEIGGKGEGGRECNQLWIKEGLHPRQGGMVVAFVTGDEKATQGDEENLKKHKKLQALVRMQSLIARGVRCCGGHGGGQGLIRVTKKHSFLSLRMDEENVDI